ncbi:hypothetical protein BH10PSE9_BH10PSE9_15100 [soil metagenome]
MTTLRTLIVASFAIGFAGSASAACFESGIGCTDTDLAPYPALQQLSCDSLWTVRNTIYDENGACFVTAKAKSVFDNTGCMYTTGNTPLNSVERKNVSRIGQVEKQKHC